MPWEVIYSIFLIDYDRHTKSLHFGDGHLVDKVWTLCFLHRKPWPFSPSLQLPCKLRKYQYVFFSFSQYVHWYSTRQGLLFIPEYHGCFSNKYYTKKTSLTYSPLFSSFSLRTAQIWFYGCFMFWGSETMERNPTIPGNPTTTQVSMYISEYYSRMLECVSLILEYQRFFVSMNEAKTDDSLNKYD